MKEGVRSVLILMGPRSADPQERRNGIKRCPHCVRFLRVIVGTTFNRNANREVARDGLQMWCRECDERRKASDVGYAWSEFLRVIERERTSRSWTREVYESLVRPDRCHWCKARLSDWGKGHKIDRIDSLRPHVPDNCVPCCSACNWSKSSQTPETWIARILKPYLAEYGEGKIPWESLNPKGPKHANIPNLSAYVVETQLSLLLGEP